MRERERKRLRERMRERERERREREREIKIDGALESYFPTSARQKSDTYITLHNTNQKMHVYRMTIISDCDKEIRANSIPSNKPASNHSELWTFYLQTRLRSFVKMLVGKVEQGESRQRERVCERE